MDLGSKPPVVEHRTFSVEGTRVQNVSFKTTSAVSKLTPLCICLSEETVKAVGPFYLVPIPGEVKDPTQGNGKYLLWTH